MRLFECQNCGQALYFENTTCQNCGMRLGYLPEEATLSALTPDGDQWLPMATPDRPMLACGNAESISCNWLVPADGTDRLCVACRHNQIIPDLSDGDNLERWRQLEFAKHRLFYQLLALRLPVPNKIDDPVGGLAFEFLADIPATATEPEVKVLTGHDNGLITINIAEADDAERERRRTEMGEPYRTLLGHFRHEVGHYYWDVLVRDDPQALELCRDTFGDEQQDYGEALKRHYSEGPPANWQDDFVSTYATAHPWEDFAETWAHYLHIIDTLETANAFGLRIKPKVSQSEDLSAKVDFNPYGAEDLDRIIDAWIPLTFAMNSLNRSMGQHDLYPFVLSPAIIKKLSFIHRLVHRQMHGEPLGANEPEAQQPQPKPVPEEVESSPAPAIGN